MGLRVDELAAELLDPALRDFSYQPMTGSRPTTLNVPFELRTVSFFASAVSSEIVFGGCVMPAFLKSTLL